MRLDPAPQAIEIGEIPGEEGKVEEGGVSISHSSRMKPDSA